MPVYAIAVFAAFFGTVMMLRQSKLAISFFIVSLIQFGYVLFIMDAIGKLGFAAAASFPIVVVAIGVGEIVFAQFAKGKGWLT